MNRQVIIRNCTGAKVQGALMAAPAWIGVTLLCQYDPFMAFVWEYAVALACIATLVVMVGLGVRRSHKRFSRENHAARRHLRRRDLVRKRRHAPRPSDVEPGITPRRSQG